MKHIVFKFILGFGNRLCNLMNMFYIHEKYPDALIYINWIKNKHCNINIDDIFDLTEYKWILNSNEYYNNIFPTYRSIELWATSSVNNKSRWDNIDEWSKHKCIVSVSFNLFSFVSNEYCIKTFNSLIMRESINKLVSNKIMEYGIEYGMEYGIKNNIKLQFIHFRNGDLVKLLSDTESSDKVELLIKKTTLLKQQDYKFFEYKQDVVDRNYNDVLESVAELIFLSKHINIIGYCPYSHFSSWIFLLSPKFIDNKELYPIFNYKIIDIILIQC